MQRLVAFWMLFSILTLKSHADLLESLAELRELLEQKERALAGDNDVIRSSEDTTTPPVVEIELGRGVAMSDDVEQLLTRDVLESLSKKNSYDAPDRYKCYTDEKHYTQVRMKDEILYAHKVIRQKHGLKALSWSKSLELNAQKHANKMASEGRLYHSSDNERGKAGENISKFMVSLKGAIASPAKLIAPWYNEIEKYFSGNRGQALHFTQTVWRKTKKIGCGVSVKEIGMKSTTYLVCQYFPAGNSGNYEQNVNKPKNGNPKKLNSANELEIKKCCDYSGSCKNYRKYCSKPQYSFLLVVCCQTCT